MASIFDYISDNLNRFKFLKWVQIIKTESEATKKSALYLVEKSSTAFEVIVTDDSGAKRKLSGNVNANELEDLFAKLDASNISPENAELWRGVIIGELTDESEDNSYNKFLAQNANGDLAVSDGRSMMIELPSLLTEQQKLAWKTEMNGGWTTNTMSISSIFPPVIKNENENKYITLRGANLNLNPINFSIKIVSALSTPLNLINVKTIPNNQVTLIDANTLNFYFNFNTEGLLSGEYKVVLNNGISEYLSLDSFEIVSEVNYIDLSTIAFNSKTYNDNPTLKMITSNGGGFIFSPDASVFPLGNDSTNIFKAKSVLPIFNSSENFYLEFSIMFTGATFPAIATGINKIGLSTNNSVLLTNDVSYGFSNSPDSTNLRPFFNGVGGGYMPSSGEEKVVFIKKGGVLICQIFHKDYEFNSKLLYGNIDIASGQDLYIAGLFQNQSTPSFKIETTITAAYKFN